ncbi:class I SAM-dependent methyltransferase [Actinomycetospora termitidis]|uniref:Class I SAM-dependent methyltransferase n=1 Tax=Actinomycetospora termitidis TaxID=3053470 RepID=A0ABT7MI17_9PSEU|nr:class I SAM-dependent methyltransferase [Actinomycetospora sp. Odt1-22]MDL5160324.1 class I SAM-dependent methyltransferase [Actinomycetospora sp. Odt1-22]
MTEPFAVVDAARERLADGPAVTATVFDAALAGFSHRLVRTDGVVLPLAVQRWQDDADDLDAWLLERCSGATLDLGCGPGRLVVALTDRGIPALGVDVSVQAIQRCLQRGAAVLHRDAFERLPGEGRWQHVVLADGNIGIGGDPVALLRRCRDLLTDGGTVLLELEPGAGLWRGAAHLERDDVDESGEHTDAPHTRFPWAVLGPEAIDEVAEAAGLRVSERSWDDSGRLGPVVERILPDGRAFVVLSR